MPRVKPVGLLKQIVVRPGLDEASVDHPDDDVAAAHRRQPMSDNEDCPVSYDLAHVVLDDAFALVIKRRGRLVEDQDRRIGGERAGDGDPLALAAGKIGAALLNHCVVALRHFVDEFVGPGEPGDRHHLRPRHGRIGQRDVLVDRAVEEEVVLEHHAYVAA